MTLPAGNLNLQQVVRDLEERVSKLEGTKPAEPDNAGQAEKETGKGKSAKDD